MNSIETAKTLMNGCPECIQYGRGAVKEWRGKIMLCPSCKSIIKAKRECWQEELKITENEDYEDRQFEKEVPDLDSYDGDLNKWDRWHLRRERIRKRIEEIQQALKITESVQ